jgi:hypothetical protein
MQGVCAVVNSLEGKRLDGAAGFELQAASFKLQAASCEGYPQQGAFFVCCGTLEVIPLFVFAQKQKRPKKF